MRRIIEAIKTAKKILHLSLLIQSNLMESSSDEVTAIKAFKTFLDLPVSTLALQYSPHFLSTILCCKKSPECSLRIKSMANKCLKKYYATFSSFANYNSVPSFISFYKSEVKRNILNSFADCIFQQNYGKEKFHNFVTHI
ncbi:unnamed protein product [Larinioides sclopetarius]|uniref:Uncharacterized protein n=1 Tax=Larinioides sclopetarius TaxID=280406 RepID=A0AAV1YWV0_9ARAC